MKCNIFCIIAFLVFGSYASYCQSSVTFFTTLDYNHYSMIELKKLQNELLNDIASSNIPAKIIDSYPSFYGFQTGFLIPYNTRELSTLSVGGLFGYSSTGGRIHYQDYSGEIKADQTVRAISLGVLLEYQRHYFDNFDLGVRVSLNYILSSFSNSFSLRIGDQTQNESPKFHSSSFGLEPGIIPSFKVWKLRIGALFSYLIYLPSPLEYDNISNVFLIDKSGQKVNIQWGGFRAGLLLSISF